LVEVGAKDNFVGAAALKLDTLHAFPVVLTPVQVCCCSRSNQATVCWDLLAAVKELQGFSFADRVFTAIITNRKLA
jgi:hypothetical protein